MFPCERVVRSYISEFRHRVVLRLKAEGWTQQQVANALHVSQVAVSKYWNKEVQPMGPLVGELDHLATVASGMLAAGGATTSEIVDLACRTCKGLRLEGRGLCEAHKDEIPALREENCIICQQYFDHVALDDEKASIKAELLSGFKRLASLEDFADIIPEVQSNLVLGRLDPSKNEPSDYAAFPGRISRKGSEIIIAGVPEFGCSRHIAAVISSIRQFFPEMRAAICIKNDEEIHAALEKTGLASIVVDDEEDISALSSGVSSLPPGSIPRSIVFPGAVGKEPLIYLFGSDVSSVIDSLERLLSLL